MTTDTARYRFAAVDGSYDGLDRTAVTLLRHCGVFRTLAEHARLLADRANATPQQRVAVRQFLEWGVSEGLLASEQALAQGLRLDAPVEVPRAIECFGVPTRNRAAMLHRALQGYAANWRRAGRVLDCVVADDSDPGSDTQATRDVVTALERSAGVRCALLDAVARQRMVQRLASESGVAAETVAFALLNDERRPVATGSLRNAIALFASGRIVLSADDDTVCQTGAVPGGRPGLAITSISDPTQFWFYADRTAAIDDTSWYDTDLCAEYERLIGRSVASCVASGGTLSLDAADPSALRRPSFAASAVPVVSAGLVGDCAMGIPAYLAHLTGTSFARLTASEAAYRAAFRTREIRRAVAQATLSTGTFLMSTAIAVDTSDLLPPFFPVHRDQDTLFAVTLFACRPQTALGLVPVTLLHAPEPRTYPVLPPGVIGLSCANTLSALIAGFARSMPAGSTRERMERLGHHLVDLAGATPRAFRSGIRDTLTRVLRAQHAGIEYQLRAAGPPYWRHDLEESRRGLARLIDAPQWPAPIDLVDVDPGTAGRLLQRFVRRFGELLIAWPQIDATSRRLRARGVPFDRC